MLQSVPASNPMLRNYKFHRMIDSGSFGTVMVSNFAPIVKINTARPFLISSSKLATWTPPSEKSKRFSWFRTKGQSKFVAVKLINKVIGPEVLLKNTLREAMQFELALMPELDHPNIVRSSGNSPMQSSKSCRLNVTKRSRRSH